MYKENKIPFHPSHKTNKESSVRKWKKKHKLCLLESRSQQNIHNPETETDSETHWSFTYRQKCNWKRVEERKKGIVDYEERRTVVVNVDEDNELLLLEKAASHGRNHIDNH